jgi:hypothetical protein
MPAREEKRLQSENVVDEAQHNLFDPFDPFSGFLQSGRAHERHRIV